MTESYIVCQNRASVREIARLMTQSDLGVVVVLNDNLVPIGLVTERDLVRKVLTIHNQSTNSQSASMVMNTKFIKIRADSTLFQAISKITKNQVNNLVVVDANDNILGIVELKDIIKAIRNDLFLAIDEIETVNHLDQLYTIGKSIDSFVITHLSKDVSISLISEITTEIHDRMVQKIIQLCEEKLKHDGYGKPPVSFCWIHMGSSGRKEQLFRTDQDNAIIFEENKSHHQYFQILSKNVVQSLVKAGFAPCKGGIMASNETWCHSFEDWKEIIRKNLAKCYPDSIRNLTVLLDLRAIYGDHSLAEELRRYIFGEINNFHELTEYLIGEELRKPLPINILGKFVTISKGTNRRIINLKELSHHIISCVRLYASKYFIPNTSTMERIQKLAEQNIISESECKDYKMTFLDLMMIGARENSKKIEKGEPPDSLIDPYKLNYTEKLLLKGALYYIKKLRKETVLHFSNLQKSLFDWGFSQLV